MNSIPLIFAIPLIVVGLIFAAVFFSFIGVWLKARLNGAPVGILALLGMRFGGVPYSLVVDARITAAKARSSITSHQNFAHQTARHDVLPAVQALSGAPK